MTKHKGKNGFKLSIANLPVQPIKLQDPSSTFSLCNGTVNEESNFQTVDNTRLQRFPHEADNDPDYLQIINNFIDQFNEELHGIGIHPKNSDCMENQDNTGPSIEIPNALDSPSVPILTTETSTACSFLATSAPQLSLMPNDGNFYLSSNGANITEPGLGTVNSISQGDQPIWLVPVKGVSEAVSKGISNIHQRLRHRSDEPYLSLARKAANDEDFGILPWHQSLISTVLNSSWNSCSKEHQRSSIPDFLSSVCTKRGADPNLLGSDMGDSAIGWTTSPTCLSTISSVASFSGCNCHYANCPLIHHSSERDATDECESHTASLCSNYQGEDDCQLTPISMVRSTQRDFMTPWQGSGGNHQESEFLSNGVSNEGAALSHILPTQNMESVSGLFSHSTQLLLADNNSEQNSHVAPSFSLLKSGKVMPNSRGRACHSARGLSSLGSQPSPNKLISHAVKNEKVTRANSDKSNRACSFYLRGHCKKEDCEFAHDLRNVVCRFWAESECFRGVECPFRHSPLEILSGSEVEDEQKVFDSSITKIMKVHKKHGNYSLSLSPTTFHGNQSSLGLHQLSSQHTTQSLLA